MSRRAKINREDFLNAVRRLNTLALKPIADYLGVGKTTVHTYMKKNPDVVKEAQDYLDSIDESKIQGTNMTYDLFLSMPIIQDWQGAMKKRGVSEAKANAQMRGFYNLCKHLNKIPAKVTLAECAKVVYEQGERYFAKEPQIKGIAYSVIRESVRNFFMSVHNVSGMHLTNLGVSKRELLGAGKHARLRVPKNVRHKFEELLVCKMRDTEDIKYFEALGNSQFNFATGTRISASLAFSFALHEYLLTKEKWMFEIWDKGSRGKKLRWEKILMGDLLNTFRAYCSRRFNIPIEDLENELPKTTEYLFPSFVDDDGRVRDDRMRAIVKPTLIDAGLPFKDFPPTHIWRHTFAQDFLRASKYNYELCASLGGWVNTHILKKHYGAVGETARETALLGAMGIKREVETTELKW